MQPLHLIRYSIPVKCRSPHKPVGNNPGITPCCQRKLRHRAMKRHQRRESHARFLCPVPHGTAVGQSSGYLCRKQNVAPCKMMGVTGKWEKLGNLSSRPFAISVVDRFAGLPTEGHLVRRREGAGPPQTTVGLFRLQSVGCKEGSHSGNSPE